MKKHLFSFILICAMALILVPCAGALAETGPVSDAPDYSQEDCWLQLPQITKDIDTFYIYSTVYVESSFEEGAPDYATLDNLEMILGAMVLL